MHDILPYIGVIGAILSFLLALIIALLSFIVKFVLTAYEARIKALEVKADATTVHQAQTAADRQTLDRLESAVETLQAVTHELKLQVVQFKRPSPFPIPRSE